MPLGVNRASVDSAHGRTDVHVITMEPQAGERRPFLLDHQHLVELKRIVDDLSETVSSDDIVVVTGTGSVFCAGADLDNASATSDADSAATFAVAGHEAFQAVQALPATTVALLNGSAIGGGFELALHTDLRMGISSSRASFHLPEARLGLIPGWGGAHMLPALVGFDAAADLILTQAIRGSSGWSVSQAQEAGFIDTLIPSSDDEASTLVAIVDAARTTTPRPISLGSVVTGDLSIWANQVESTRDVAPAWPVLVDLLSRVPERSDAENRQAQIDALVELIPGEQLRRARYAMRAVAGVRAQRPTEDTWRPQAIGVIGAGLMANQLASVLAASFQVPVVMRDITQEAVDAGVTQIDARWRRQVDRGQMKQSDYEQLIMLISGTTALSELVDCDFVIEAVPEVMAIKQQVFGEIEEIVSPDAILATNTSALSVTEMSSRLKHPERVVGLHFFNPVDRMPLVEIVHTDQTSPAVVKRTTDVTDVLQRHRVQCGDRPGFVVNRLLVLLLSRVLASVEAGAPIRDVDASLQHLGLPMSPFTLLDLVTPAVADHVLRTLNDELGPRFIISTRLCQAAEQKIALTRKEANGESVITDEAAALFNDGPVDPSIVEELSDDVLQHLAAEVTLMLDESVTTERESIDAAMILGAGWPFHLGGITPYLIDRGYLGRQ